MRPARSPPPGRRGAGGRRGADVLKVVCDSNTVISGLTAHAGGPYEILEAWRRGEVVLLLCEASVAEVVEVLGRAFFREQRGITPEGIARVRQMLEANAVVVAPKELLSVVKEDPDDDRILECALEGGADYLVSGDHHLLRLRRYEHLPIVTAREFLAALEDDRTQR